MEKQEKKLTSDVKRIAVMVVAALLISVNIKSFVNAGGLFPGGFNGLTLLIQKIAAQFFHLALPFSVINFLLNAVPAVISFKFIGKRFTLFSCLLIVLSSLFTDLLPSFPLTYDVLLICIFGGLINGLAVGMCLMAGSTSGGTDFIAIFFSEKYNIDTWNYIFMGNAAMLLVAGLLFGWDKALYSIIFQFTSTQMVQMLHRRYKKHTMFIISDHPEDIYNVIQSSTRHGATIFQGTGAYDHEKRSMVYSVVSSEEVKRVVHMVREVDPSAFVNVLKTDQLDGRFYQRPND